MSPCKIYGSEKSFRTQKVLIAANIAKREVVIRNEKPPHDKFPLGMTPAIEDGNVCLFGAEPIMMHLAKHVLKSDNCVEVLQWLQWAEGQLLPNVLSYVLPSISVAHVDVKIVEAAKAELFAQLKNLDNILLTKTFLVGERFSFADISVALDLLPAFESVLDETARKNFVNVTRWFKTIINQPQVKQILGEITLATDVAKYDHQKFKKISGKQRNEHSEGEGAKHKHAHEKPKGRHGDKHAAKEKKPKEEDDADEIDEIMAQEPKAADPFESMPKGTFVMDAFKRVYSNEDTATKAIPYFWEHFDPENFSIWYSEYKYAEDLTLTFMSCNLIGGMFQRLEKLKKNAFASVCLFGSDNHSTISGVWIWRGHELVFPLSPDWQIDYESYEWTKMDPKDAKTKKIVNEYFMWEGDFGGKKFNQGKILK